MVIGVASQPSSWTGGRSGGVTTQGVAEALELTWSLQQGCTIPRTLSSQGLVLQDKSKSVREFAKAGSCTSPE